MNKVLIVEDERAVSEYIRVNLTEACYLCECVYNGQDAADIID